jgi:hypothetical protein
MHPRFRLRRDVKLVSGGGYQPQDVGDTGWTIPIPTARNAAIALMSSTQTGSRIYYVHPRLGNDATGLVMFWDGTRLIDQNGLSADPVSGIPYGTDPMRPSLAAKPFKHWAWVGPRGGSNDIGTYTAGMLIGGINTAVFRAGKPDWWMFKRGETLDWYTDYREFLDGRGFTAQAINALQTLTSNGGLSPAERCVFGAYGELSEGRARITHPHYAFVGKLGSTCKHTLYTGLYFDGSVRDRAIRPVDWPTFTSPHLGTTAMNVNGANANHTDLRFEDCHWNACMDALLYQFNDAHVTPIEGVTWHRCLVSNNWGEQGSGSALSISRAIRSGTDPAQVLAGGTTAVLTYPTEQVDSLGSHNPATGVFTVPSGWSAVNAYYRAWVMADAVATVPTNQTIQLALLVNDVVVATKSFAGTGVTDDTYRLYGVLYSGAVRTGHTIKTAITTLAGVDDVTVVPGTARWVMDRIAGMNATGCFMHLSHGARYTWSSSIVIRNGFGANPLTQVSFVPDGVNNPERWDWDIRNHNFYTVGDPDSANCHYDNMVSLVGAAGWLQRNAANVTRNFFYEGYVSYNAEHNSHAYTESNGQITDNVLQRYKSLFGTNSAHPAWGFDIGGATVDLDVLRNIVSDVQTPAQGQYAIKLYNIGTPYFKPQELIWRNDTQNARIEDNILDATKGGAYMEAIQEANGAPHVICQWRSPLTPCALPGMPDSPPATGSLTGTTVTCNPVAGYTGTPTYQWWRYNGEGGVGGKTLIVGATSQTYVLTADDWANTAGSENRNYIKVNCMVAGIEYPPGAGIDNTSIQRNIVIKPAATPMHKHYSMNDHGDENALWPPVYDSVPTFSNAVIADNPTYTARSLVPGWLRPDASMGTYLASIGHTVNSSDGLEEYYNWVIGADPQFTAARRGMWDERAEAKHIVNHIRTGRGMLALP